MKKDTTGEFAWWVNEIAGDLSSRQVEVKTGISHTSILSMRAGGIPSRDIVTRFADGMDVEAEARKQLFAVAGYDDPAARKSSGEPCFSSYQPGASEAYEWYVVETRYWDALGKKLNQLQDSGWSIFHVFTFEGLILIVARKPK